MGFTKKGVASWRRFDIITVELVGRNLIIREAQRKILVDILFEPPSQIKIQRGHFFHNGIEVEIKPDCLYIGNNRSQFAYCSGLGLNGLNLGIQKSRIWGVWMEVEPRFKVRVKETDDS